MNLQERTILVLLVTLIAVLSIISVFVSAIYLSSYTAIEQDYVAKDLGNAVSALDDEQATLSALVSDWGPWEDTYDFVNGKKPGYVEKNLIPETFGNININIIIITDAKGKIVYAGAYDLQKREMVPVPESLIKNLTPASPLLQMANPYLATTGLVALPEGPLVVASRPIVHANYSGQAQGVMLMGRYLNPAEMKRLGMFTDPSLNLTRIDDPALPAPVVSVLRSEETATPELVQAVDKRTIAGYTVIRDINKNDAFILSIIQPRTIYTQGIDTTLQFIAIILAAGLVLGIVILIFLDRFVLSRIGALSLQVQEIGGNSSVSRRLQIPGDDELSGLGNEINRMLEKIEKTQQDLQQSESRFRELTDLLPLVIFEMDIEGNITYANKFGLEIFGMSPPDLEKGLNARQFLIPADVVRMFHNLKKIASGVHTPGEVYSLVKADKTSLRALVYTTAIIRNGTIRGFRGCIIDITERLLLEDALRESEEKYRALTESTPDVLFSMDTGGILTYVSPQVNQYGFLVEELVGKPLFSFIHPEDRERIAETFRTELTEGAQFTATFRVLDKWEHMIWFEEKSFLRLDQYGKPAGVYGMLRDVTERKRAEDAIELANKKLNLMNNITRHDILNTITGLLGCVDMVNATTSPGERAQLLGEIKDLTRVIQRQINFTKEYQEVGVHLPKWQNVSEVIRRVEVNFANSGVAFAVDLEDTEIYADPLLEKVFYNLIDNAIRYGEKTTMMKFYFLISDKGLSLICEDDGVGISDNLKQIIFERGVGRNTGMGLFLTREILSITGISIEECGTFGSGARFEMLIPRGGFRFGRLNAHSSQG